MTVLKDGQPLIQIPLNTKKIMDLSNQKIEPINMPEECDTCGFTNFNIGGTLQNQKLTIKVSCMKCGNHIQKINQKIS